MDKESLTFNEMIIVHSKMKYLYHIKLNYCFILLEEHAPISLEVYVSYVSICTQYTIP